MSLIKYQINTQKQVWIIPKQIKCHKNVIPKNPGITQKGTQKSGRIQKGTRIITYASYNFGLSLGFAPAVGLGYRYKNFL